MRALLLDPEVLLLDEPLSALDPLVRTELRDDLRGIFRSLAKTVIVVTHDVGEAAHLADVVVLMRAGRVVQQGPFATLAATPADPFVTRVPGDRQRRAGSGARAAAMTAPRGDAPSRCALLAGLAGVTAGGASGRPVVVASKSVHRVGDPGRDGRGAGARRRRCRRAPPPARRHRGRLPRARDRRRRRLPRVHRDADARRSCATRSAGPPARRRARRARPARRPGRSASTTATRWR